MQSPELLRSRERSSTMPVAEATAKHHVSLHALAKSANSVSPMMMAPKQKRPSVISEVHRLSVAVGDNVQAAAASIVGLHVERWSYADWIMGTFNGQMTAIGCSGALLIMLWALAIDAMEHSPGERGPTYHDYLESLWISW